MFCTKCGKELPEGTNFCTACGQRLKLIEDIAGNRKFESLSSSAREILQNRKLMIGIISAICVIIIVVATVKIFPRMVVANKEESQQMQNALEEVNQPADTPQELFSEGEIVHEEASPVTDDWKQMYQSVLEQNEMGIASLFSLNGAEIPYLVTCEGIYHYEDGNVSECFKTDQVITDVSYYENKGILQFSYPYNWLDMNIYVNVNTFQIVESCALDDIRDGNGYPIPEEEYHYYDVVTGDSITAEQYYEIKNRYPETERTYHMSAMSGENAYGTIEEAYENMPGVGEMSTVSATNDWKQIYFDNIDNVLGDYYVNSYALVDITGDGIPEVFCESDISETQEMYYIVGGAGGTTLDSIWLGYISGWNNGAICASGGRMGVYYDNVYKYDESSEKFIQTFAGKFCDKYDEEGNLVLNAEGNMLSEHFINDALVEANEYYRQLEEQTASLSNQIEFVFTEGAGDTALYDAIENY